MYRSWKTLLIDNENDLRSSERIRKLQWARNSIALIFVIIGFTLAGIACIGIAFLLIKAAQAYLWSLFMLLMSAVFFWGANQFLKERKIDPIRNYLRNPQNFEFIKGELVSATYQYNDNNRRNSRMMVEGQAKTSDGVSLLFYEDFDPSIWPFVEKGAEKHLKAGDDWFELKGLRKTLPIQVYVLYQKHEQHAVLIGIDREFLNAAMKVIEKN